MSAGDAGSSGLDGFAGEVYRDLKSVGRWLGKGIARPFQHHHNAHQALAAFNPDFPSHGADVTALVNYGRWHESDKDWREGNGLLTSATYGELPHLWTRVERFARYEARLYRFIRRGGEIRRVFVIGEDLNRDATRFPLYRTLQRHQALGFAPRVRGVIHLEEAAEMVGVRTDVLGCFNGRICYFLQSHDENDPTMARSIEPVLTYKVQNLLSRLWSDSSSAKDFFSRHQIEVPEEIKEQVRRDIETVEEVAYENRET